MEIIKMPIGDIKPYPNNPRKNDDAVAAVVESIKQCGYCAPIVVDEDGVVLAGHTRLKALKKLGRTEAEVCVKTGMTKEQKKKYRLLDNKTSEFAAWDFDALAAELDGLDFGDFDFGFDEDIASIGETSKYDNKTNGALMEAFIHPPFSVLDARSTRWQERKKVWHSILASGNGRAKGLLGTGLQSLGEDMGTSLTGTSIFDPCLAETLLNWFSPRGGKVIDPFAGGSVRGIVSQFLDREYHGCDLSKEQIEANENGFDTIDGSSDFFGDRIKRPHWYNGDSTYIDQIIPGNDFDMLLTCPPYADLEVYSDDPADISNMEYEDFLAAYEAILGKAIAKLKDNSFACVVVGEVRDKKGFYRNFIGDTIAACEKAGAKYYNEIVLITMAGTAAVRAKRVFSASRKVINTHQKALIFLKSGGDEKALCEYMDSFARDRIVTPMKESILVFLKGNGSHPNAGEIEKYDFPEF